VKGFRETVLEEQEWLGRHLEFIAELDRRQLFYQHSSLRSYLSEEFGIEKWAADRRIRAARLIRRMPWIQEKIGLGKLRITHLEDAMGCAAREKLSSDELSGLLESVCGMSTEAAQCEFLTRYPQPVPIVKDRIRPLTSEFSEVKFVCSNELLEKLEEVRSLLAHARAGMTMAQMMDRLATEFLERNHPEAKARRAEERRARRTKDKKEKEEKEKSEHAHDSQPKEETDQGDAIEDENLIEKLERFAATRSEVDLKTEGRVPTAEMVYALIQRDGYQCSHLDLTTQERCTSRFALQVDHVKAWHLGGETRLSNLRYLCRSHHRRVSFLQFGESSQYFGKRA